MAMAMDIPAVPPFNCSGELGPLAVRWDKWVKAFRIYITARGIDNVPQKRALLLHCGGPELQELFETLVDPGPAEPLAEHAADVDDFEKAIRTLSHYFKPKKNIPYERHRFRKIDQEESETVDQFITKLRLQAEHCVFGDAKDDQIRDQVIDKCRSNVLRRKLLEQSDLTLDRVQEVARALEAVDLQSKQMSMSGGANANVNAVSAKKYSKWPRSRDKNPKSTGNTDKPRSRPCYRCKGTDHWAKDPKCPAKDNKCGKCGHIGHLAETCHTKPRNYKTKTPYKKRAHTVKEEDDEEYAFKVGPSDCLVDIVVGGVNLSVMIDSGSSTSIVDRGTWDSLKQQGIKCQSGKTDKVVYAYGSSKPLKMIGKFVAEVQAGDEKIETEFLVLADRRIKDYSLLGRKASKQLKLLRVGPPESCDYVHSIDYDIVKEYPECFQGLGKLKDYQAKIHIDPNVTPVAQNARRIPFSMREKVDKKIQEMLDLDIIEKVEGPTPWVSPVVVIPKSGDDIRLTVDMRRANEAVIRERHPIPTFDEILENMNGSDKFSKLDLNMGFHQVELEPESRGITTFAVHSGLYRHKRVMMGISSAPELYQHVIRQVIADCEGAENVADDIIVHGKGAQHDTRLRKVMDKLQEKGLTLNAKKCQFGLSELDFVGHTVSGEGIRPMESRVKALANVTEPKCASEVRSFLGLANYSAKFIPNLSTKVEPLRKLTRKNTPFIWGEEQAAAFRALKEDLAKAEHLAYFDKDAETKLITDASPVGLGAVLVQVQSGEPRVLAYASRTLTDVERRYSQTEKEALAIVWACERFHVFLYGIDFEILSDHRPLETIYSAKSNPPARIQRWVLRLQSYKFKVKYLPGHLNIADSLSRLTKEKCLPDDNDAEEYVRLVAQAAVPRAMSWMDIEKQSSEDEELVAVRRAVHTNKWGKECAKFLHVRNELCVVGDLVLRGTRIVPPKQCRDHIMSLAHEGHIGMVGMKMRLRTKVWWPGLDKEVEKYCKTCHGCQLVGGPSRPEPLSPTELPKGPWQILAVDLLGPLPSGDHVLVCIDYYSRYYEIDVLKVTTAERVITSLDKMFTTHGFPIIITSDNGSQFVAAEFRDYMMEIGVEHRRVTPLWPQANGEVERQNRSLLKRLRIAQAEKKDWRKAVREYLLAYRSTPHTTTGVSPAELMFGRTIRTKLPELRVERPDEEMRDRDMEHKEKSRLYTDAKRRAEECELQPGDAVLLRQDKKNKLSTNYESEPYEVVQRQGNSVVILL